MNHPDFTPEQVAYVNAFLSEAISALLEAYGE